MADFTELVKALKQSALDAVNADVPVGVFTGEVISDKPLKIQIDQKLILTMTQLVLTRNVTDYKTDETVNHFTEYEAGGSYYALFQAHNHRYVGRKEFLIHHKLETGDKVLLLREQGGKHYYVLDRLAK